MGLLDNLFQSLDNTLKDIADGGIEKKIAEGVDALGTLVEQAPAALEKVADAPARAIEAVEGKSDVLQQTVQTLKEEAGKTINVIRQ